MNRSLVAATAVALLLTGCATGDTGHLDPEIQPDLLGPRSNPVVDPGAEVGGTPDDLAEAVDQVGEEDAGTAGDAGTPEPGASAAPADGVEAAFAEEAGAEAWFAEVSAVDVDGGTILVTTSLTQAGADALAICEAALAAAESTGVPEASVEVRSAQGERLSGRDAAAGDDGCAG